MNPILSIIVATRNRIPYCINLIETILSFTYDNFELVIQDNSDTLELSEFLKTKTDDKRLIYNYTPPPFSSIDNFNAAIGLASGQYVCMIGDDDGVTHEIFTLVEWMKRNSIDAVKPNLSIMYRWPDACEILPNFHEDNGNLEIRDFSGEIKVFSVIEQLNTLMSCGAQNYLERQLPKLYHGIVARKMLLNIKEKTGYFAGGLSPDIYWVVSLSKWIDKVVVIDYPITIPGVCAVPLRPGEHMGKVEKLEDAPHFRARGKYEWSNVIPRFYCAENIWADSAYAALVDNKITSEQSKFNLLYLSSILFGKYPDKRELIVNNLVLNSNQWISKKIPVTILRFNCEILKYQVKLSNVIRKIKNRYFRPIFYKSEFKNVASIQGATELVLNTFKEKNISLEDILKRYQTNHFN